MIVRPPAKINLGLQVVALRKDGYRDIRTVMVPVPLFDLLEAVVDPEMAAGSVTMTHSGRPIPGDPAKDLCLKALAGLSKVRELPGLRIHLHKVIPTGAGLGGGSSDGAHLLLLLNQLLELQLNEVELHGLASGLGSDCAFFLKPGAQLAEGRGELLSPVPLDLGGWWLVLANPGTHVSTAEVYANTPARPSDTDMLALMRQGPEHWPERLVNDMEAYVFSAYPEVDQLKERFLRMGAVYAAMSGSGSTVFGLFRRRPDPLPLGDALLLLSKF